MRLVLTHRPAPNKDMAFKALHGTAYCHHHGVDLHRYLPRRSQHKDLLNEQVA